LRVKIITHIQYVEDILRGALTTFNGILKDILNDYFEVLWGLINKYKCKYWWNTSLMTLENMTYLLEFKKKPQ